MRCTLVQQILDLDTADECRVASDACRACGRAGPPRADRPNAVVSSLVYQLARDIRHRGGQLDCDVGRAWQAECYVRETLSEEPGKPAKTRQREKPLPRAKRTSAAANRRQSPRIGLFGHGAASGVGYLNRDLAEHLAVDTWFVTDQPHLLPVFNVSITGAEVVHPRGDIEATLIPWLKDLDWVVCVPVDFLPRLAREVGTRVACVPMWEWTSPTSGWLRDADLMICPTRNAYDLFIDWKRRFGFRWHVVHFPWPVSSERFRFRLRERCQRFVFVNGHGGAAAREIDSERQLVGRKGLDLVLAAAALMPDVSWIIYTQAKLAESPPANVEVRQGPAAHEQLYQDGDVCVQPSRWEGIGLPLLECQMAGMPLVTIDAPPMNEYQPLRVVAPSYWQWGFVLEGQPMRIPEVAPEVLAGVCRELHGSDIRAASMSAHEWARCERSWRQAVTKWREIFELATEAKL
jgi:glycosyltransferase involved in cell wall biosynthesis